MTDGVTQIGSLATVAALEAQVSAASDRVQALVVELAAERQRRQVAEAKLEAVADAFARLHDVLTFVDKIA